VVRDVGGRAIETDEGVLGVVARVDDVSEQIAGRVLCTRTTEMEAQAPEDALAVLPPPALHGQAGHEQEAPPSAQLAAPARDVLLELGQREVLGQQIPGRLAGGDRVSVGRLDLIDLRGREGLTPRVVGHESIAPPGRGATDRRRGDVLVRPGEIVGRLLGIAEVVAHET
jgi:hypothetical protein